MPLSTQVYKYRTSGSRGILSNTPVVASKTWVTQWVSLRLNFTYQTHTKLVFKVVIFLAHEYSSLSFLSPGRFHMLQYPKWPRVLKNGCLCSSQPTGMFDARKLFFLNKFWRPYFYFFISFSDVDTFSSLFSTGFDDMDKTSSPFVAEDEKSGLWVFSHW